ncbi:MAG: WD40 repeat domain-containing protein, partial [Candidatus Kapaibacterium sp.]
MKKLIITILLLASSGLYSSEIVYLWNTEIILEDIIDLEFMPNGEEFMLTSITDEIQIRDVYTGGIKKLFRDETSLFMKGYFEFTPDSTRVVMGYDGLLQLIRLEDFERLDFYAFVNDTIENRFRDLVLDPIKPYVYTIISGNELTSGNNEVRSKISIYNYETMELVSDLTDYIDNEYTAIAISNEGKYLAALNEGKANLRVWDLETKELVKLVKLYDDELEGNNWCEAKDIQFSEFNTDIIYYSGRFVYKDKSKFRNGLITYNFKEDTYSNLWLNTIQAGKFMFLDEEKTLLNYNGTNSHFYDLDSSVISKKIEMSIEIPFY